MQRNNTRIMKCTKMLRTTLPPIFGTRTYDIICNRGKKRTVLLKLKNSFLNVRKKKKYVYLLLLVRSVRVNFGLQKKRAQEKKKFHLFLSVLKFQSQHEFSDHLFLKQVLTPFLPTISLLNPYSTALYFIFPSKTSFTQYRTFKSILRTGFLTSYSVMTFPQKIFQR